MAREVRTAFFGNTYCLSNFRGLARPRLPQQNVGLMFVAGDGQGRGHLCINVTISMRFGVVV